MIDSKLVKGDQSVIVLGKEKKKKRKESCERLGV